MKKKIIISIIVAIMAVVVFALTSCGGCNDEVYIDPNTPITVEYPRVAGVSEKGEALIRFNAYYYTCDFDVRISDAEITEENFNSAEKVKFSVEGEGVGKTMTLKDVKISLENKRYVAVRPFVENDEGAVAEGNIVCIRLGGNELLPVNYNTIVNAITVHHGESLRDFGKLFDEQKDTYFKDSTNPVTQLGKLYSDSEDLNDNDGEPRLLSPIVDFEYLTYISKVSMFIYKIPQYDIKIRAASKAVDFDAEDSEWDKVVVLSKESFETYGWYHAELGIDAEYVQVCFVDGNAPVEVLFYGYQSGESDHAPTTEKHKLPKMNELIGMCGFVAVGGGNTTIEQMSCVSVMREYHNFGWTFNPTLYPGAGTDSFHGNMGNFDAQYLNYGNAGINVIPCIQWNDSNKMTTVFYLGDDGKIAERAATAKERFDPNTYQVYAHHMFMYSVRYGRNTAEELSTIAKKYSAWPVIGAGTVKWLELGNEPNGEGNNGYTPYQLAALTSAAFDGHENSVVDVYGKNNHFGAKNADPSMKLAMAGIAGIGNRYVASMVYWMKANRTDGAVAMDAFNVHTYFCKEFKVNGQMVQMGVSPEEFDLIGAMSQLVDLRNKYYPEKEVWLTEFGWDTATSYNTKTACHAYGEYTARQVQAMWLTRAYLLLSSSGVDKATMYMCEDGSSEDTTSNVQYGTCGVYDVNGKAKDSYYYLYTLKNTLGDYTFTEEIDSGRSDVMIYKYVSDDGKVGYAVWCPTSDGTKVEGFKLYIGADGATLVENAYGEKEGIKTDLTASDKIVSINVSENPIYVMVG